MDGEILRVRLPKALADALSQQALDLKVGKPDLARVVIGRGLLGLRHDRAILPVESAVRHDHHRNS